MLGIDIDKIVADSTAPFVSRLDELAEATNGLGEKLDRVIELLESLVQLNS